MYISIVIALFVASITDESTFLYLGDVVCFFVKFYGIPVKCTFLCIVDYQNEINDRGKIEKPFH
jgi:hypothetical protein